MSANVFIRHKRHIIEEFPCCGLIVISCRPDSLQTKSHTKLVHLCGPMHYAHTSCHGVQMHVCSLHITDRSSRTLCAASQRWLHVCCMLCVLGVGCCVLCCMRCVLVCTVCLCVCTCVCMCAHMCSYMCTCVNLPVHVCLVWVLWRDV